jgi:hypothetical protein
MSYDEAPNQPNDDASSLQARRARLRGSLAKQAIPPDPYKPDPYLSAGPDAENSPANHDPIAGQQTVNQGSQQPPGETVNDKKENQPNINSPGSNGQGQAQHGQVQQGQAQPQASPLFITAPTVSSSPFISATAPEDPQPAASSPFSSDPVKSAASSLFSRDPQSSAQRSPISNEPAAHPSSSPFIQDPAAAGSSYSQSPAYTQPPLSKNVFVSTNSGSESALPQPDAPASTSGPQAHVAPPAGAVPGHLDSPFTTQNSVAGSAMSTLSDSLANLRSTNSAPTEAYKNAVSADDEREENNAKDRRVQKTIKEPTKSFPEEEIADDEFQAPAVIPPNDPAKTSVAVQSIHLQDPLANTSAAQVQVIELLNNMDQAMGACAMNLSALQKAAGEQTEALRSLTETLQHQTFSELGLNLTSLMESLSAALEPMKAVGELVPAIDQLVSVMEAKVASEEPIIKVSPDHLLISLADQLGAGVIDPWTFKSAYMAVFPDDQPPELMHRLVELLGAQRLTGDLFRNAYDAVQAPDPPERSRAGHATAGGEREIVVEKEVIKVVQDEAMVQQLEQLKRSQETFEVKMKQRENEFADMLGAKEQELQEAQELLNSRWEEFNARYDELTESLQKRDEVIQAKESELARKESENAQLRAQMEELREMMTELQKQFSGKAKEESQKNAAGFFDTAPGAQAQPAQSASLFDAAPSKPLFQTPGEPLPGGAPAQPITQNPNMVNQNIQAQMPQQPAPQAPPQQPPPQPQQMPQQPISQPAPSSQAVPRQAQATTPFAGAGPGSYGSGVRAQVFEVIVRQALAGAPWREICAGPMQVNNISPDEVEAEVKRRQALLGKK